MKHVTIAVGVRPHTPADLDDGRALIFEGDLELLSGRVRHPTIISAVTRRGVTNSNRRVLATRRLAQVSSGYLCAALTAKGTGYWLATRVHGHLHASLARRSRRSELTRACLRRPADDQCHHRR